MEAKDEFENGDEGQQGNWAVKDHLQGLRIVDLFFVTPEQVRRKHNAEIAQG